MEITDIEQAIEPKAQQIEDLIALYENGLLTAKGLIWFYLHQQQIAPHQLNPKRASAELGISLTQIYVKLKELIHSEGSSLPKRDSL